jgi:hypothetical protein
MAGNVLEIGHDFFIRNPFQVAAQNFILLFEANAVYTVYAYIDIQIQRHNSSDYLKGILIFNNIIL